MKNYEGKMVFPLFMFFDDYESGNVLGSHSGAIPKIEVNLDFLIQLHSYLTCLKRKDQSFYYHRFIVLRKLMKVLIKYANPASLLFTTKQKGVSMKLIKK